MHTQYIESYLHSFASMREGRRIEEGGESYTEAMSEPTSSSPSTRLLVGARDRAAYTEAIPAGAERVLFNTVDASISCACVWMRERGCLSFHLPPPLDGGMKGVE